MNGELASALEEARGLGIQTVVLDEAHVGCDGRRRRAWVARRLDTGTWIAAIYAGQSDAERLEALQASVRRLMLFDDEVWFVHMDEDKPTASLLLSDVDVLTLQQPLLASGMKRGGWRASLD